MFTSFAQSFGSLNPNRSIRVKDHTNQHPNSNSFMFKAIKYIKCSTTFETSNYRIQLVTNSDVMKETPKYV